MYLTKYLLYLVFRGGKVGGCASLCNMIHKSEDSFEYVLFFYHMGPGHQTLVVTLGNKYLYLMSRLANLLLGLFGGFVFLFYMHEHRYTPTPAFTCERQRSAPIVFLGQTPPHQPTSCGNFPVSVDPDNQHWCDRSMPLHLVCIWVFRI